MSFAQDNGYAPETILSLLDELRVQINAKFNTTFTAESFVGTNWYKYAYAILQKVQENDIKASEIFQKLQEYIALTNEKIQRPSVSSPGVVDSLISQGFVASVKPPEDGDAGKIFIAVDLTGDEDDYDELRLEVCTLIKNYIAAGVVSQGSEIESIVLSNGQSFDFKFNLPNRIPVLLRLTIEESENNLIVIPSDEVIRQKVFDNVNARYRLGLNFEPERYYGMEDAPWAGTIKLEWSDDAGANWDDSIFDADYDDLYTFDLEDIEVVLS